MLRYGVYAKFSVILGHLLPLYHTNILKNQNFEKMKNMAGDHHFTLVYQN